MGLYQYVGVHELIQALLGVISMLLGIWIVPDQHNLSFTDI